MQNQMLAQLMQAMQQQGVGALAPSGMLGQQPQPQTAGGGKGMDAVDLARRAYQKRMQEQAMQAMQQRNPLIAQQNSGNTSWANLANPSGKANEGQNPLGGDLSALTGL